MELSDVISILRGRPVLVAVTVLAAVAAGFLTLYRVSGSGLKARSSMSGVATAQVLIDAPQSAIGDLKQDTAPLVARAGVFAQLMASTDVRDQIARTAGVQPWQLVTAGPFPGANDVNEAPPPSAARGTQTLGELARYRLDFSTQPDLPLLTIVAKAPNAAGAARLADAAVSGLRNSVSALQGRQNVAPERRVVVRGLGAAQARTVSDGPGKAMAILAALAVLLLGFAAIVGMGWSAHARELAAAHEEPHDWADDATGEPVEGPARVGERRVGVFGG